MSTPAGWYDDGSGRQRWWDGTQWTEHYAPPAQTAAAAPASSTAEPAVATEPGKRPPSVISWVGLGLAVLGLILSCIPATLVAGWILLAAGLIVSIVAFFFKGAKWTAITGTAVAVVGSIIAVIVFFVYAAFALAGSAAEYIEDSSSDYATTAPDDDPSSAGRPSVDEVAAGLADILQFEDQGYTDEQVTCIAQELVEDPDMSDETLRAIADGSDELLDVDTTEFSEGVVDAMTVCLLE